MPKENFTKKQIKEASAIELASRMRIIMEAAYDDKNQDKISMADAREIIAIDEKLKEKLATFTTFKAKKEIMDLIKISPLQ